MSTDNVELKDSIVVNVEQLINICVSPYHIDVNLLHVLLTIIASKLNLQTTRIQMPRPDVITEIKNIVDKSKETVEVFKVTEGGAKKPFRINSIKLEKIEIESEPPVDTLFKVTRNANDLREIHRVTFSKSNRLSEEIYDSYSSSPGALSYAELLNLTKRLECCEIGIEKLAQLVQGMGNSYKELQRLLVENTSNQANRLDALEGDKKTHKSIADSNVTDATLQKTCLLEIPPSIPDQEARKDISLLQGNIASLIDQLNGMFVNQSNLKDLLQALQDENDKLKKALEKSADRDKLERCCKEICNMQKLMGQFKDKTTDLIALSNKSCQRLKDVEQRQGELTKLRTHHDKIEGLEEKTKNLYSEFEKFTERLEYLKVLKADREELDFLFQTKADEDMLQNYVTLELFNAIRRDLSNGLVQSFENIMDVDLKWKKSEEQLYDRLNEKMDISEKAPLMKYVNDKLVTVQDALNRIVCTRFDIQSAGVRTRALKDAHCICCTNDADIVCDVPTLPKLPPIRRIRKVCPEPPDLRRRYCGGSHTVLNVEHKMTQRRSAPINLPTSRDPPDLIEGANGMMYRVGRPQCTCAQQIFPKVMYPRATVNSINADGAGGDTAVHGEKEDAKEKLNQKSKEALIVKDNITIAEDELKLVARPENDRERESVNV